jgi:hypothetical protein
MGPDQRRIRRVAEAELKNWVLNIYNSLGPDYRTRRLFIFEALFSGIRGSISTLALD